MSRFLVSRTAAGYRFLLESESGRALVRSKDYATLDACKKGICALVYYAPIAPLVDAAAGERAPNPKIEIMREGSGFCYAVKSANGKSVIVSAPFASRKACLRSLSMLRAAVQGAPVLLAHQAELTPLVVSGLVQDVAPAREEVAPVAKEITLPALDELDEALLADEPVPEWEEPTLPDEVIGMASESAPSSIEPTVSVVPVHVPSEVKQPRRVKLKDAEPAVRRVTSPSAPKKPAALPSKKPGGVLSRLFKR